jgi:hypothetical protein
MLFIWFSELFIVLLCYAINSVKSNPNCPNYEEIFPCRCLPISETLYQIECAGEQVNDEVLTAIAPKIINSVGKFHELYIHDSKISDIAANTFAEIVFTNIIIENNEALKTVDPFAFKKGVIRRLAIRRNKALEDLRVYELARYLEPIDTIEFDGNALEEIPQNAFTPLNPGKNKLKRIFLNHNKIEKLHSNAFYGLPELVFIALDFNEIEEIHENGLKFSDGKMKRKITVKLNNNQNKEENIAHNSIEVPQNVSLELHMENNELTHLPQFEFNFLESEGNKIYLLNNDIICDCSIKWALSSPQKNNIFNLQCKNFGNLDILQIKENELLC